MGEAVEDYEVHHVLPLEYSHLFPRFDINQKANLVGMHADVHRSVNKIWAAVRKVSHQLSADDVEAVASVINKRYGRWLDVVYEPTKSAAAVAKVEQQALNAVQHLLGL